MTQSHDDAPVTFDLGGSLPGVGTTVLEASAGTGKTFAVAALATRFVAEGITDLDKLLVITFSRAATQELRDRVRERFVETASALADPGSARTCADPDIVAITRAEDGSALADDQIARRRGRLLDAIANYDAATIATTHEFCHAVLRSLGVAGSLDASETLREDISDLRDEVVDDRFLALYADQPADPPVTYKTARNAARKAVESSHSALRPIDRDDPEAQALVSFATEVRAEIEIRKRRAGVFTFDDMLTRLAAAIEPSSTNPTPAAAARMRARWDVVLVDEFQDTDPVQWDVLRHAFTAETRLILIGDPKQAIYAFRGGDTPTYLRAVRAAEMHTLGTNYRSDAVVVDALQKLTVGAELGDQRIRVHHVDAFSKESSLSAGGGFRLRQVRRDGFSLTKSGTINIGKVREHIAEDLAADIARQLADGVTLDGRELNPGDIAVLMHSVKDDAQKIQGALSRRGIPSVINSAESVMSSAAAQQWLRLLEAMEKPQLPGRIRAAALTHFFPDQPEDLLVDGDDRTDELAERVRSWLDLLRSRGVAAVSSAAHAAGLAPRVLAQEGGERLLTDLNHVGQLLHAAAQEHRFGISGLLAWLRNAVAEGNRNDSRRRRLDVDAKAVQFVTIHGSKGLEYPIVYLPQLFDRSIRDWPTVHAYHEGDLPCLDLADSPRAKAAARTEEAQEELRLAYVALTRARAQVVAWWAPTYNAPNGALTRLIFGRGAHEAIVQDRAAIGTDDDQADAVLRRWADLGAFVVETSQVVDRVAELAESPVSLVARTFDREVDTQWRRTSYSGLIRAEELLGEPTRSEPESEGTVDEDEPADAPVGEVISDAEIDEELVSPMNAMAGSATFGSLVHAVLEHADPQAPDLRAELLEKVETERRWWSVEASSEDLADALLPMQHTSLGPLADGLTLSDFPLSERLRELDFEIPMADGDLAVGSDRGLPLAAFAAALRVHLQPDDPMRSYADKLEAPGLGDQVLRGYLSGSIDAVLRVPGSAGPRYVVVDYKTNTLGERGRPQTAWDYAPDKVTASMLHSHYPLQALLYSVVLHRYLRWRQPGYDPAVHLGGVLYLYVRGMVGAQTPEVDGVPCGVFSWQPPVALVLALSAILEGEEV